MRTLISAIILAAVLSAGSAGADLILSVRDTGGSDTWHTAAIWQGGLAPTSAHDYQSGHTLRTTGNGSTFAGHSLTMTGNGIIALKGSLTVPILHMQGGSIQQWLGDGQVLSVAGSLYADAAFALITTDPDRRDINLTATITGSAAITSTPGHDNDSFTTHRISGNNAATFHGDWLVQGSGSGSAPLGLTDFSGVGSFGSGGDLTVAATGRADFGYDYQDSGSSLVLSGVLVLDQNLAFGSIRIAGVDLAPGMYSFATLNSLYDARFQDGGTGSLTVLPVPEPASAALLLLGAGLLAACRRRA